MHIIIGGTGHVGSGVASALLAAGEQVTIVTRDAARASAWRTRGAELAEADVRDADALRKILRQGRRAFVLNPPAEPSTDTDAVERSTVRSLVAALEGSGLEMVVAQSTYGARPQGPCGDLNVLYELEQALAAQPIPARIVRAAYHFENWDMALETARTQGFMESTLPLHRPIPMAAPADIGAVCAKLLLGGVGRGTDMAEGPRRYTPNEVADVFEALLGKPIERREVPEAELEAWFDGAGFSPAAARSYACMTRAAAAGEWAEVGPVHRGSTTLQAYFAPAVQAT
ncbi:NmrA family NAD(P)-binding protein [Massilia sp. DD77]|uniref:NmrA family NAD(P)-binding protein n=1 Tax=Massilia sp. DD77 TaxID=3109349 RepID=UPI002FFF1FA9